MMFVNRWAVVVKPAEEFADWANSLAEDEETEEAPEEEEPEVSGLSEVPVEGEEAEGGGKIEESAAVEFDLGEARKNWSVYLIPDLDEYSHAEKFVKMHCGEIFEYELSSWDEDEENWPADRSYEAFKKWFDFEIHDMVVDLCEIEIDREEV